VICPLCRKRKARRVCPALDRSICTVCCGTKRLVEIRCPPDCGYLSSAREHPPAVVQRQREHDLTLLVPVVQDLTRRQSQIFFLLQTTVAQHKPEGFYTLTDDDAAEAAAALAATLETAERGVIYEHRAASPPAAALARSLRQTLEQVRGEAGSGFDRDAAVALRAVERAARELRRQEAGRPGAYLELAQRFAARLPPPEPGGTGPADDRAGGEPRLIIP